MTLHSDEPLLPLMVPMAPIAPTPPDLAVEFEAFWGLYPRRIAKGYARRAYATARKKVSAEKLIEGVKRYAAACTSDGREACYIAHPSTWLNGERWEDEYGPLTVNNGNGNRADKPQGGADAIFAAGIAAGAIYRARNSGNPRS